MKSCIICGTQTNGSIGVAGIRWSCICQECKDMEDRILANNLKIQSIMLDKMFKEVKDVQGSKL